MRSPKASDNLKPVEKPDIGIEVSNTASTSNQINSTTNGSDQKNLTANATSNTTTTQTTTQNKSSQSPPKPDFWSTITSSSPDLPWTTADSPDPFGSLI